MSHATEGYLRQLKQMHEEDKKWGTSAHAASTKVLNYAKKIGADNILDYGCGKGTLKDGLLKKGYSGRIREYDIAIPGKDKKVRSHLVACVDVMEHVEEQFVDSVLAEIAELSVKGAYFIISHREAIKILPDGRNAHITIKAPKTWEDLLKKHFTTVERRGMPAMAVEFRCMK